MSARQKGEFSSRAQKILGRTEAGEALRPASLSELMEEDDGLPESRQDGKTEDQEVEKVRLEARIPEALSETLRAYVYQHRSSKAAVVAEALQAFFEQKNFKG